MNSLSAFPSLSTHRVLLVNDDGIQSEGLELLESQIRNFTDDVWVVAPDEEKSGASHSISLTLPMRVRRLGDKRYAVKGTPADCVILAYWELMAGRPPTVILSGINHGENLSEDMTYSGTTGAAMEGAILGVRSIALSQVRITGRVPRFDVARSFGPSILRNLLSCTWEPGIVVNVNFPDVSPQDISGIELTKLGQRRLGTFRPMSGVDGRNLPHYWIKVSYDPGEIKEGTDLAAMRDKAISITPLHLDLTSQKFSAHLQTVFGSDIKRRATNDRCIEE
jgi:5'-nucleotidase